MIKPRLVFMGTPAFAVSSLQKLVEAGHNIVGVITTPDKPAGRGLKLAGSEVKKFAIEKGLKILQPEKLKNEEFLSELRSLDADVQMVVAFRMLPEVVWNMPPMGTINLHASLLPQYRGAAPINWAIINGEKETGLTTFKLKHEIDTGNILMQQKITIYERETAGELHDRMKIAGANLLVQTLNGLTKGTLDELDQKDIEKDVSKILRHAPKLSPEVCKIDWDKNVNDVNNLIRGLSPYPAAFTFLKDKKLKIFTAETEETNIQEPPGEVISDHKTFLKFTCENGYISV
ncbi:MAG: methionyl-tRNA formyltransferase, partial [Ginsengibacter sp.]